MSGEAKALNYYNYGSTAPAMDVLADVETKRIEAPPVKRAPIKGRVRRLDGVKSVVGVAKVPGISVFAVIGALVVSVLMVFVVLAQISYNEAAGEAARLNQQLRELTEKHRTLELAFESSIDIKEVERVARDELGMSRPDAAQIIIVSSAPRDVAVVLTEDEASGTQEFVTFIRSLIEYFR